MDPQRLQDIAVHLEQALQQAPSSLRAYLGDLAGRDPELAAELEALLARHSEARDYFDSIQSSIAAALTDELDASAAAQRRFGPYRTVRRIGAGGMGVVFLAERADGQFEKRVALKLIRGGRRTEAHTRRFLAEREILARLEHPNIARLLDGGVTEDGAPYLVMEYVDGEPLTRFCDERGLSVDERLRLLLNVCGAVQYLHRHLIVHGDLKPGNVLVDRDGVVKLVDFGIAMSLDAGADDERSRSATSVRGFTPRYAAPEQVRGGPITTVTDVYGLGVVLYELLAGVPPYVSTGPTAEAAGESTSTDHTVWTGPPSPPSERAALAEPGSGGARAGRLRGDLDAICMKAIRQAPESRYGSIDELAEDLRRHRSRRPVLARAPTLSYRTGRLLRRHAVGSLVTAGIVLLSLAAAAAIMVKSAQAERERDKAEQVTALLVDLFRLADPGELADTDITAREVLDRGAVRIRHELAGQPELRADLLSLIGRVYQNLGLYDAARPLLEESAALTRAARGPRHPGAVEGMNRLGALLRLQGDHNAAEALLREALAASRDPATRARTLDRLGLTLLDRGDLDAAEAHLSEALAHNRRHLPADDPEIAENLANLGGIRVARGDFAGADPLFREALELRRRSLGPRHPSVASTLSNLAAVLANLGLFGEALTLQREALALYEDLLGDDHPRVATMRNNLGLLHLRGGDAAAAEPELRRSLEIRRLRLAPTHPELAQSLANLALTLQELGRYDDASPMYEEALEIRRAAYGPDHAVVGQTLHNLGLLHRALGEYADAISRMRSAMAILQRALGPEHPVVAIGYHDMATVLLETGELESAERGFRRALEIRRATLASNHPHRALTELGLGEVLVARGDTAAARPLLAAATPVLASAYGEANPHVIKARSLLAAAQERPDY